MPTKVPAGVEDSWIDDLPHCEQSGEGHSVNQIYRRTGHPVNEHADEDAYFRLKLEADIQLYGIFDGHDGKSVSEYAAQKMPAELFLGQVTGDSSDDEIREAIRFAFQSVEKGFMSSIDDSLAARTNLLLQNSYESMRQQPDIMRQMTLLNLKLAAGSSGAICLVFKNKLFVANVGDTRVLLCRSDQQGQLRVLQLSTDHTVDNEDEAFRLNQLGLNDDILTHFNHPTRCLGCFPRKGAYKDFELLSKAIDEPVISLPEIRGPIALDESCRFLILMSSGTYNSLIDATGSSEPNGDITSMVGTAFLSQPSLSAVAQSVVDQVARLHHDAFQKFLETSSSAVMTGSVADSATSTAGSPGVDGINHNRARSADSQDGASTLIDGAGNCIPVSLCRRREDMTVVVRNFNFPLPCGTLGRHSSSGSSMGPAGLTPLSLSSIFSNPDAFDLHGLGLGQASESDESGTQVKSSGENTVTSGSASTRTKDLRTETDATYSTGRYSEILPSGPPLPLDSNNRIAPYVDFSEYFEEMDRLRRMNEMARIVALNQVDSAGNPS